MLSWIDTDIELQVFVDSHGTLGCQIQIVIIFEVDIRMTLDLNLDNIVEIICNDRSYFPQDILTGRFECAFVRIKQDFIAECDSLTI